MVDVWDEADEGRPVGVAEEDLTVEVVVALLDDADEDETVDLVVPVEKVEEATVNSTILVLVVPFAMVVDEAKGLYVVVIAVVKVDVLFQLPLDLSLDLSFE